MLNIDPKLTYTLHFDGGKKDDILSYGFVIYDKKNHIVYENGGQIKSKLSSNVAEYCGLIIGLHICSFLGIKKLNVFGDSKVVINQVNTKPPTNFKSQFFKDKVEELKKEFEEINICWVAREANQRADRNCR